MVIAGTSSLYCLLIILDYLLFERNKVLKKY